MGLPMSATRSPRLTLRLNDSWGDTMAGVLNVAVWTGWVGSAMSRTKTPGDLVGAARVFVGKSRVES